MKRTIAFILLIATMAMCLCSCDQISQILDFSTSYSVKSQNAIADYSKVATTIDKAHNAWAEIKSVDGSKITLVVHASPMKDIIFSYSYTVWSADKTYNQGRQFDRIGSGTNDHADVKVKAAGSAEVVIDVGSSVSFDEGAYVLEAGGLFVYFELVKA